MRVIIESPFAGDIDRNIHYARQCMYDCFKRGEFPFASHLLYTQVLNDLDVEQRKLGINAGLDWGKFAEKTVVYVDFGISNGMQYGIDNAKKNNREIEYRSIL